MRIVTPSKTCVKILTDKEQKNPTKNRRIVAIRTEVYSRIVGYYRPVQSWNDGKKEEFAQRSVLSPSELVESLEGLRPSEMERTG